MKAVVMKFGEETINGRIYQSHSITSLPKEGLVKLQGEDGSIVGAFSALKVEDNGLVAEIHPDRNLKQILDAGVNLRFHAFGQGTLLETKEGHYEVSDYQMKGVAVHYDKK